MKTEVRFADADVRKAYEKLKQSTGEDKELYGRIRQAIDVLSGNPEAGIRIEKKLWPKFYYQKYNIDHYCPIIT